ncbi:hypothetical protein CGI47_09820, partial [Vibrio parahaemolyticus]
ILKYLYSEPPAYKEQKRISRFYLDQHFSYNNIHKMEAMFNSWNNVRSSSINFISQGYKMNTQSPAIQLTASTISPIKKVFVYDIDVSNSAPSYNVTNTTAVKGLND